MSRSRAWCFTINNDTFDDLTSMMSVSFRYLVYGFERGKQTQTPHIQGYIYMHDPKTKTSMKKRFPRAHLEQCKGSPEQNFDYTTKEGEYYEFGVKPTQGQAGREQIEEIMKNPFDNFRLYSQYRKAYKEVVNAEVHDHERRLVVCDVAKIAFALEEEGFLGSSSVCLTYEHFNNEDVVVVPAYLCERDIMFWSMGIPSTIGRGYEVIKVDPRLIIVTYSQNREYKWTVSNSLYKDLIDHVYD